MTNGYVDWFNRQQANPELAAQIEQERIRASEAHRQRMIQALIGLFILLMFALPASIGLWKLALQ